MKKILIIEDDPQIARALRIRFQANGYEAVHASDATLGANLALQSRPDLIVLDIGLPDGNGLQLAQKFQRQPETQFTPIIFVTANKDPNLRQRAMEMRIAGLLEKPYDPEELLAAARYALGEMVPLPPRSGVPDVQPPADPLPPRVNAASVQPRTILLVEDDPSIAKALALRIEAAGYKVTQAHDAVNGLKLAFHNKPDLVLLDITMPGGTGIDLAERLQALQPHRRTPVIFLTASKQPEYRRRAQELGAAGFFEKPYDPPEVLAAIRRALGEPTQAAPPSVRGGAHEHSRG